MLNLPTKRAGGRAGCVSQGCPGGGAPRDALHYSKGISIEPNRSAEPNMTETEPTESGSSQGGNADNAKSMQAFGI
eukprot:5569044-Alexandrium_andersonii.AAC.1